MKRFVLTAFVLACSASAVQAAPIIAPGGYPAPGGHVRWGRPCRQYRRRRSHLLGLRHLRLERVVFGFSGVTGPSLTACHRTDVFNILR